MNTKKTTSTDSKKQLKNKIISVSAFVLALALIFFSVCLIKNHAEQNAKTAISIQPSSPWEETASVNDGQQETVSENNNVEVTGNGTTNGDAEQTADENNNTDNHDNNAAKKDTEQATETAPVEEHTKPKDDSANSTAGRTEIRNVQDAMEFCISDSIFTIRKGMLYENNIMSGDIYVIILSGSDMKWDENDIRGLQTCLKSGFSQSNLYLDALVQEAKQSIPQNERVVLIGHSLGGMVAQQFAANKEMKNRYQILNVLTMGSPYIITDDMEGTLHRMADSGDAVPYLSAAGISNFSAGNYTYEDNGYFGNPSAAHFDSYRYGEKWAQYDCFGVKNGNTRIVLY